MSRLLGSKQAQGNDGLHTKSAAMLLAFQNHQLAFKCPSAPRIEIVSKSCLGTYRVRDEGSEMSAPESYRGWQYCRRRLQLGNSSFCF